MTSWFIDDNVKIIICLHQFLPSRLTHAADSNKNSSKYLLYDIAPGNRVGALTNMFEISFNYFLKWAFCLTVFLKVHWVKRGSVKCSQIYEILIFYCQPLTKNLFQSLHLRRGRHGSFELDTGLSGHRSLTSLAELKSNYHFCTEPARMFEAIMKRVAFRAVGYTLSLDC